MVTTEVYRTFIEVKVGSVNLITFAVSDRYHSNGHRRPRNMAVYVSVKLFILNHRPALGASVSITEAIEWLKKLEVDPKDFIKICQQEGWGEEVPVGQEQLF